LNKKNKKFGIILMIDALGVSSYTIEESEKYLKKQTALIQLLKEIRQGFKKKYRADSTYHISNFGDTLLMCFPLRSSKTSYKSAIEVIIHALVYARLIVAWGVSEGILFRGAISIGNYLMDEHSVIGPAIYDASEWYESANCIGVILSPKSQLWLESICDSHTVPFDSLLMKYDVPLTGSSGQQTSKVLWTVAWPETFFSTTSPVYDSSVAPRATFLKFLFEINETKAVEPKFLNSLAYFDAYSNSDIRAREANEISSGN
jgi:hypothetical protein